MTQRQINRMAALLIGGILLAVGAGLAPELLYGSSRSEVLATLALFVPPLFITAGSGWFTYRARRTGRSRRQSFWPPVALVVGGLLLFIFLELSGMVKTHAWLPLSLIVAFIWGPPPLITCALVAKFTRPTA